MTALPRCRRLVPPCYVPEGDSPLSLHATVLFEYSSVGLSQQTPAEEESLLTVHNVCQYM